MKRTIAAVGTALGLALSMSLATLVLAPSAHAITNPADNPRPITYQSRYTALLAGAGIRGGTVYGESDSQAAYVKDKPVRPADLCATIYRCLGIDPELRVPDHANRPVEISQGGQPIDEVLA